MEQTSSGHKLLECFPGVYIVKPVEMTKAEQKAGVKRVHERVAELRKKWDHAEKMLPVWKELFERAEAGDFDERPEFQNA